MSKALVLNATYEPLCVVPVRRAVVLVLKQKAEVLHATDRELHSERSAIPVPSVIRLTYFVMVPFRARAALRRHVEAERRHLLALRSRPVMADPKALLDVRRQELEALTARSRHRVLAAVHRASDQVAHLRAQVRALSARMRALKATPPMPKGPIPTGRLPRNRIR